jgi:hypothetical protein
LKIIASRLLIALIFALGFVQACKTFTGPH